MVDAVEVVRRIEYLTPGVRQELVVWRVPSPVRGSAHPYKYRLALVANDSCVIRYDNEAGKGDHKHLGEEQHSYRFVDIRTLFADFDTDVARWIDENGGD